MNTYPDPLPRGGDSMGELRLAALSHRRMAWGAILGGVVLVVIVQLMLSVLGAGIGFSSIDLRNGSTPDASSFGIGAGLWWIVSTCIALFVGCYVAGRFAVSDTRLDGMLHGLVTWGITTLLTLYLLTSAIGGIIGGGFSALGSVVSAAGSGVKQVAQPIAQAAGLSPDEIRKQAEAYLQPAGSDPATMTPQEAQKEVARNLVTYEAGGADAPAAKQRIVSIMAAQLHISEADATKQFDDAQAKLTAAKNQAIKAAKTAADASAAAASDTSFAVFGDLLIGAIAAALGGLVGSGRRRLS